MLRITALVKHTPELTGDRKFAADFTLDRDAAGGRLSELDEHTAEQAIRLKEAAADAELTYVTMGPAAAAEALRRALSMGGDRAVHISDEALHGADVHTTAIVLARAIERIGFDILLCGMASTDAGMGAVPAMLAERLGVPQLSLAAKLTLDGDAVTIERDTQAATETVRGTLPALVSVTDRTGEARYPTFKGIMAAKKKQVETWTLADLGIGAVGDGYTKVLSATPRPPRAGGEIITDDGSGASQLTAFLSAQKFI